MIRYLFFQHALIYPYSSMAAFLFAAIGFQNKYRIILSLAIASKTSSLAQPDIPCH